MIAPILHVKDVDASIAFYEKLGFITTVAMPGPDGVNAMAFMRTWQSHIGLARTPDDYRDRDVLDIMIYLPDNSDIDGLYYAVKARGIHVDEKIKTQFWGDRTFTLYDLDGYRITLSLAVHQPDMEYVASVMNGEAQLK